MSRLTSNFVANTASAAATALIAIFLIPLYIRVLGLEAYGLIGFYLALRGFLQVLDLGAGPVVSREVARYAASGIAAPDTRDALHTFQGLYWMVGGMLGCLLVVFAPLIAGSWLQAESLSHDQVTTAVRLIGVLIGVQWPSTYYQSALLGLERQVVLSVILTSASIATHLGALAIMILAQRHVAVFFACAIALAIAQVLTLAFLYRKHVRFDERPLFRLASLRHIGRFAAGVGIITLTGSILAQTDKVFLSSILPLARFAQYSLAATVAAALVVVVMPIFNTFYPRYSSMLAAGREAELRELHHFGSQLVVLALVPAAFLVVFFGRDLVELWTHDAATATAVAPLATLLVAGAVFNGFMILPYALQLAHGWTRAGIIFGVASVLLYLPVLAFMAVKFGAAGGATAWLALNVAYFAIMGPVMHLKLLPGALGEWLVRDLAIPTVCAAAVTALWASIAPRAEGAGRLLIIVAAFLLAGGAAALAAGRFRTWLIRRIA